MKKYILFLVVLFSTIGNINASISDNISLKVYIPMDSANKSYVNANMEIANNTNISLIFKFIVDLSNDLGGVSAIKPESYFCFKVKDLATNQIFTADRTIVPLRGRTTKVLQPNSTQSLFIEFPYEYYDNTKYEILQLTANILYYTDDVVSLRNYCTVSDIQIIKVYPPTPCCAPEPVQRGNTPAEAVYALKVRAELKKNLQWLDIATSYRGLPDSLGNPFVDTTRLSTLFDLAKNSWQVYSITGRDVITTYLRLGWNISDPVKQTPYYKGFLKAGAPNWKYGEDNYFNDLNCTQTWQTVPTSPYGWYKFTAPSGYDVFLSQKNRRNHNPYIFEKNVFNSIFFIAYDGSVYCLHIIDEKKTFSMISKQGEPYSVTSIIADYYFTYHQKLFIPENKDDFRMKWGFIEGSLFQEDFLDCFRRLYDEGNGFSKEDAYNAAFAYMLEGYGVELYRRAPDETEFKRYNTTAITEPIDPKEAKKAALSGSPAPLPKIIGYRSTIWQ